MWTVISVTEKEEVMMTHPIRRNRYSAWKNTAELSRVRENLRDRGSLIAYWPGEDTDASRVDDYNAEWET